MAKLIVIVSFVCYTTEALKVMFCSNCNIEEPQIRLQELLVTFLKYGNTTFDNL